MQFDKPIIISYGKSRLLETFDVRHTTWSEFITSLRDTHYDTKTMKEYLAMTKDQQTERKDVGAFVGGELKDGNRKQLVSRSLLTLDADHIPEGVDLWKKYTELIKRGAVVYSTRKHKTNAPRLRLIILLDREVDAEEYEAISRYIASLLGMDFFDDTTYQSNRLMFYPSTCKDSPYVYEVLDAKPLEADKVLAKYENWRDISQWPTSSRTEVERKKLAAKQGDPLAKDGVIGAFCRVYSIHDVIEQFLSHVYTPSDLEGRYTYVEGSTSGGLVVYDDKFAYSHHSTDPASMKLCNSFDLVRLHLFKEEDTDVKPDTPINRTPSFKKMAEFALQQDLVKQEIASTRLHEAFSDFSVGESHEVAALGTEEKKPPLEAPDWVNKLEVNKAGAYLPSYHNIMLIMHNDTNLKGLIAFNEFEARTVLLKDPTWRKLSEGHAWQDRDDVGLEAYIEKFYGIQAHQKILGAIVDVQNKHRFHPIREYLDGLVWDGKERLDNLFIDYLGADGTKDNDLGDYNRAITRKFFTAAVARVYEPGAKFDYMLVLSGPQGIGKSSLMRFLGRKWFSDSLTTFSGKEAMEEITGNWIIEIGELTATKKADIEAVKQFLSKTHDEYRPAYGRNKINMPRQCVFVGTTNDHEFLRDKTGNRRFWIIDVGLTTDMDDIFNGLPVDQLWAEAKHRYRAGEPLYLNEKLYKTALEIQDAHLDEIPDAPKIRAFVDMLLPEDWDERSLERKREFMNKSTEDIEVEGTLERTKITIQEVYYVCLGGRLGMMSRVEAKEITDVLRRLPNWEYKKAIKIRENGRSFVTTGFIKKR